MIEPVMFEHARLVAAGWRQALTGRWFHDDMPAMGAANRRRLFSTADALALVDADPSQSASPAKRDAT